MAMTVAERRTNRDRVRDYISRVPGRRTQEIAKALSLRAAEVSSYITQLKARGIARREYLVTGGRKQNRVYLTDPTESGWDDE